MTVRFGPGAQIHTRKVAEQVYMNVLKCSHGRVYLEAGEANKYFKTLLRL